MTSNEDYAALNAARDDEDEAFAAAAKARRTRLFSLVSYQGTAIPETTCCEDHRPENIRDAAVVADADVSRGWQDTTDNPEVACVICGEGDIVEFTVTLHRGVTVQVPASLVPDGFQMPKRIDDLPDALYDAIAEALPEAMACTDPSNFGDIASIADDAGDVSVHI